MPMFRGRWHPNSVSDVENVAFAAVLWRSKLHVSASLACDAVQRSLQLQCMHRIARTVLIVLSQRCHGVVVAASWRCRRGVLTASRRRPGIVLVWSHSPCGDVAALSWYCQAVAELRGSRRRGTCQCVPRRLGGGKWDYVSHRVCRNLHMASSWQCQAAASLSRRHGGDAAVTSSIGSSCCRRRHRSGVAVHKMNWTRKPGI